MRWLCCYRAAACRTLLVASALITVSVVKIELVSTWSKGATKCDNSCPPGGLLLKKNCYVYRVVPRFEVPTSRQITVRIVGYHFTSWLTATFNLCMIYFKITWALSTLLEHMHKKFEIHQTKIKGSFQSGRKVVTHDSKRYLPLVLLEYFHFDWK